MNKKIGDWMLTYTGKRVELGEPDPASICIEDIAWHLSGIGRYTGAATRTLSVLEHSMYVMQLVKKMGGTPKQQLHGLLHDAHEAYIGDITTPMKRTIRDTAARYNAPGFVLVDIEVTMDLAIQKALGVKWNRTDPLIKKADMWSMAFEREALLPPHPDWAFDFDKAPARIIVPKIMPLVPRSAMAYAFIRAFRDLKEQIDQTDKVDLLKLELEAAVKRADVYA